MIRVVLDTNILVSSCYGGKPRAVMDLWARGKLTLCMSEPIFEEYREVLARLGLDVRPEAGELLRLMASGYCCLYAATTPSLRVVAADPDDDKFIECAVALEAEAIITGDKALAAVGAYFGTTILPPAPFLDWFRLRQESGIP